MRPITSLGLIANLTRPRAREGVEALICAAKVAGIRLLPSPETAEALGAAPGVAPEAFAQAGAQGVISLGGDGSFLAAAHAVAATELPLIGLNIGRLGYLTAVNEEGFGPLLQALAQGRYAVEARTALAAGIAGTSRFPDALNDVVVSRSESGHAIALLLELDGFPVARYLCDGLILATPTGSTAYSLSVGGPVVSPAAKALVISVIAPHALSARPLVIPDGTRVVVRVEEAEGAQARIYADGVAVASLAPGAALEASASPRPVRLLLPEDHNPYAPLALKLGWSVPFRR